MDWAQILVIMLAVLFALFLIVAIALAILLFKVTRQIKATAASAERTVHLLEDSVGTFNKASKAALPLMVARGIMSQVMKSAQKNKKKPADD